MQIFEVYNQSRISWVKDVRAHVEGVLGVVETSVVINYVVIYSTDFLLEYLFHLQYVSCRTIFVSSK